jgi:catechol 2,3-dioxygenase-like lactoylglutathione lyase family enzyme
MLSVVNDPKLGGKRMPRPEGVLSHVELNVSNLEQAISFYDWFLRELGYVLYQEWEQGRSWRLGETYIVVVQVEENFSEPPFHRKRVGLNHLAFHAASIESVDRVHEKLTERNVPILYGGPRSGDSLYALYFEGPDRLKLEYVCENDF